MEASGFCVEVHVFADKIMHKLGTKAAWEFCKRNSLLLFAKIGYDIIILSGFNDMKTTSGGYNR